MDKHECLAGVSRYFGLQATLYSTHDIWRLCWFLVQDLPSGGLYVTPRRQFRRIPVPVGSGGRRAVHMRGRRGRLFASSESRIRQKRIMGSAIDAGPVQSSWNF